jgi:hypothetical protein
MQVARRLGRSLATVRRMEGVALHPTRSQRGVWLFDEAEVEEVARDVADSGRALPGSEDNGVPPRWQPEEDPEQHEPAPVADACEFERAQRRISEQRVELAALRARVSSLEEDIAIDLGEGDDDEATPGGGALLVLLLGALGLGLILFRGARPSEPGPSQG